MKNSIASVLIERDGFSKDEAEEIVKEARIKATEILCEGGSYDEISDMLNEDFSLEPDYLMDLI